MRAKSRSWQQIATCTTSSGGESCTLSCPASFASWFERSASLKRVGGRVAVAVQDFPISSSATSTRNANHFAVSFKEMLFSRETCSHRKGLLELDKSHYTRINGYVLQVFIAVIIPAKRMEIPSFFLGVSFSATLPYISLGLLLPFFCLPLRRASCLTLACLISGNSSFRLHIHIIMANKGWHDHTSNCWLQGRVSR